jgi:hypothetical protein
MNLLYLGFGRGHQVAVFDKHALLEVFQPYKQFAGTDFGIFI